MKIIGGYQDTRTNGEDFALTPYLFLVIAKFYFVQVYGIGLCWGFWSIYLGIGFNIPKEYSGFRIISKKPDKSKNI